jgi:peptidyl-dipeptidase Dcp
VTAEAAPAVPNNILLADWTGKYDGVPPWDQVKPELFPEAFQFAVDEQRREIDAIVDNPAAPTFQNTVEALEKAGQRLGRVGALFGVMTSNMSNPQYQALQKEWGPKLSAASDRITLDPKLFARIKAVYDARAGSGLDAKQQRLVTRLYESYGGAAPILDTAQKQQLSATTSSSLPPSPASARRCLPTRAPTSPPTKRK